MKKCIGQRTSKIDFFTSVDNRFNRYVSCKTTIIGEDNIKRDLSFYIDQNLEYLGEGQFLIIYSHGFVLVSGVVGSDYGTNPKHTTRKGVRLPLKSNRGTQINTLGKAYKSLTLEDIKTGNDGLVNIWGLMTKIEWIGSEQQNGGLYNTKDWFIIHIGSSKYLTHGYAGFEFEPILK